MLLNRSPPDDDPIITDSDATDHLIYFSSEVIEYYESDIDPDQQLYLFTFNPDPSELPDADFQCQHEFAMMFVVDFLRGCRTGLACVETTQLGNPHYHGWYQLSDDPSMEMRRIVAVKVMQKYAPKGIRITKATTYRVNSYTNHANCLYYYKKDIFGPMLHVDHALITKHTVCDIDWEQRAWWFDIPGKKTSSTELIKKMSDKKFYEEFYRNSDPVRAKKV